MHLLLLRFFVGYYIIVIEYWIMQKSGVGTSKHTVGHHYTVTGVIYFNISNDVCVIEIEINILGVPRVISEHL